MKTVGLFSGIGGLDLPFQKRGIKTELLCDLWEASQSVLSVHFPAAKLHSDIATLKRLPDGVDVVTAGFPCQDISHAGTRQGITGARSSLWHAVAAAIGVLRPGLVFVENVAALRNRGLDRVLADLAAVRYDATWLCLRASDVGAAHRRDRLFLLATPTDGSHVADPLRP